MMLLKIQSSCIIVEGGAAFEGKAANLKPGLQVRGLLCLRRRIMTTLDHIVMALLGICLVGG